MKYKIIFSFLLLVLLAAPLAAPPARVVAQSGQYYFVPQYALFYEQINGYPPVAKDLTSLANLGGICGSDELKGAAFYLHGTLDTGATIQSVGGVNTNGWYMIGATQQDTNQMLIDFRSFYTMAEAFQFQYVGNGTVSKVELEPYPTASAWGGERWAVLYEAYFYCYGSNGVKVDHPWDEPYSVDSRFTLVETDLTGSYGGYGPSQYYADLQDACGDGKPAASAAKVTTNAFWYWGYDAYILSGGPNWFAISSFYQSRHNTFTNLLAQAYPDFSTTPHRSAWHYGILATGYEITFHKVVAYCFDATPPDMGGSGPAISVLRDGDMEQQPISNYWFPNMAGYSFGRFDTGNPLVMAAFGQAACGEGFQVIGNLTACPVTDHLLSDFYCGLYKKHYSNGIRQSFNWPGGKMYYRFSAKALPENGWDRNIPIEAYVSTWGNYSRYNLFVGSVGPGDWHGYSGSTAGTVPAGTYTVVFARAANAATGDAFALDDVAISNGQVNPVSCTDPIPATPTTVPGQPTITPVRTATATPPGFVSPNYIDNCGFEAGETGWDWQPGKSFVIYGPSNNYSHAEWDSPNPGVAQAFYWPGGTAYVRFQSDTNYNVYFRNLITGSTHLAISENWPYGGGMVYHQSSVYMPTGPYELRLHHPAGQGPSQYDNISVNAGGYGSCTGGANATPTVIPTSTQAHTPTMWPTSTRRPTSTTVPGGPTPTAVPSFTPFPTYTPVTPQPPTLTPRPPATYTPHPTYTPAPTYTPNAQGTIEPSVTPSATLPPQPPPGYYSDCQRPISGDVPGWIEYNRCVFMSYFEMSPNAVATVAAVGTPFAGREPFGTFQEVRDTNQQFKELIDSYDWQNTGLPGNDGPTDLTTFFDPGPDSPWFTGHFDFTPSGTSQPNFICSTVLANRIGGLAQGMCLFFNILAEKGITPWIQLLINLGAIFFLGLYIYRKWIDAGAGG